MIWFPIKKVSVLAVAIYFLLNPGRALAMHISEGILPFPWAVFWFLSIVPILIWGLRELKSQSAEAPYFKPLVGLVGAAVFIISCMPIPVPFAGTCSHPCGTGLAAILIGPALTVVIASVALTLQALFLAHGGLTTLGANIFSMGVGGAFVGYGVYKLGRWFGAPWFISTFLAGMFSDWATYALTSLQVASALHSPGNFKALWGVILLAFIPTQVPLGILEGFLCVGTYRFIFTRRPELLRMLVKGSIR